MHPFAEDMCRVREESKSFGMSQRCQGDSELGKKSGQLFNIRTTLGSREGENEVMKDEANEEVIKMPFTYTF